jgi:chromosome segregation ATPase
MSYKFIKIRINETTRDAFQKKAKAEGVTMTQLIQNWIEDYLEPETCQQHQDDSVLWQRLETLEEKLETVNKKPHSINQESEQKLEQYIHYLDQRIDTLENVVINPLRENLDRLQSSWTALFNQIRELEGKVNQLYTQIENIQTKTKQNFARLTQYINQKLNRSQDPNES